MIEYRGTLAEGDVMAAMRLRGRALQEGGSARDGLLWLGIALAVLPAWAAFSGPDRGLEPLWWWPFSLLCLAVWWRRRTRMLQRWRQIASLGDEQHGRLTDGALEAPFIGVDARIPWAFFSGRVASRSTLLLLAGTHVQLILAASQFPDEAAWRRACEHITQRVPAVRTTSLIARAILWFLVLVIVFLAWHFAQIKPKPRAPRAAVTEAQRASPLG